MRKIFFFAGAVQRTLRVCGLRSSEMTLFIMSPAQQDVKESAIHRALRKADSVTLHWNEAENGQSRNQNKSTGPAFQPANSSWAHGSGRPVEPGPLLGLTPSLPILYSPLLPQKNKSSIPGLLTSFTAPQLSLWARDTVCLKRRVSWPLARRVRVTVLRDRHCDHFLWRSCFFFIFKIYFAYFV